MEGIQEFLGKTYFGNTLTQYLYFFGVVVGAVLLGRIACFAFKHQLKRATARTKTEVDDALVDSSRAPVVLVLFAAGLHFGKEFLTLVPRAAEAMSNVSMVIVAVAITWLLLRLIDLVASKYIQPLVKDTESKLDDQLLPILRKSTKTVIALLAAIVVFSNLGYDILSVLAGLGIGGLAIALAAQDALKNVIAGLTLFWDKPFQLEDWVVVGPHSGEVTEIGMRSTRLKTEQGTVVVIPNSTVADSSIENYSSRVARRRNFVLGLTYDSSADEIETAVETIRTTIRDFPGTDSDNISVRFVRYGEYSLDIEIVYWITDLSNWKALVHDTHVALKRNLDAAGVRIAFPTATRHVVDTPRREPPTG